MPKYHWTCPNDWLSDKIDSLAAEDNVAELANIARDLLYKVDADTVQDLYQDEMEEDGYFNELP